MAGIKISNLPPVVTPALSDVYPIDQGAVTYKVTNTQILSLFQTNASGTWGINISGNSATVTTNANLTGDVTSVGNATTYAGLVPLNKGGLNAALVASNGGIFYSTATAGAILSGTATAGQMLRSGASTAPTWSTATFPATATNAARILRADGTNWVETTATFADIYSASSLLYSNGANNIAGLATANNGLPVTSNTGVPSILAGPGTTGNVLQSNAAAAPSWSTATYPATAGTSGNVVTSDGTNFVSSAPAAAATTTITDDTTTNATMYPTWVTAATGSLPLKVSSTKMSFNPSTATLTLAGPLSASTGVTSSAGVNLFSYSYTPSAVNYFSFQNNTTGNTPSISAVGSDANVNLQLGAKASGTVSIVGNGVSIATFTAAVSAVNYFALSSNATGTGPVIYSTGSDSSIPFLLGAKNAQFIFTDITSTVSGKLQINNAAQNHFTALTVATAQAADYTITLPAADGTAGQFVTTNASGVWSFSSTLPASAALGTPASGTLTNATGYTVANLADVAWTDISGSLSYTGYSVAPTGVIARQKIIGKSCFIYLDIASGGGGTSDANTFTVTGFPQTAARQTYTPWSLGFNLGANATCLGSMTTTTLTMFLITAISTYSNAAWGVTGGKGCSMMFMYEIA